jgi:hypothetical protein
MKDGELEVSFSVRERLGKTYNEPVGPNELELYVLNGFVTTVNVSTSPGSTFWMLTIGNYNTDLVSVHKL